MVPILLGVGMSFYTTSALADNCFWADLDVEPLYVHTRLTKNIVHCGKNVQTLLDESPDWSGLSYSLK